MSRWQPETLALGMSGDMLAAAEARAAAPAGGWDLASLGSALQACGAARGCATRLLVCPDLCRHFAQPVSAGLRTLGELQTLAALRSSQLFGGAPQAWAVVADWSLTQPMVCAALPATLLQALRDAARQLGLALGVESAALAALATLSRRPLPLPQPHGFLAWASPAHLMLARAHGGAVHGLRCLRRRPDAAPAELMERAAREARQEAMRSAGGSAPALVFAWPGSGVEPPHGAPSSTWFDAAGMLPSAVPAVPAESEAAWACRLATLT